MHIGIVASNGFVEVENRDVNDGFMLIQKASSLRCELLKCVTRIDREVCKENDTCGKQLCDSVVQP